MGLQILFLGPAGDGGIALPVENLFLFTPYESCLVQSVSNHIRFYCK